MKKDMICVVYVDDTILTGPDAQAIENVIKSLVIKKDDQMHTFELRDEGEVGDFLGIRIEKGGSESFQLSQTGLINKVLKASGMEDANTAPTPSVTDPLGSDKEGESFNETWQYATVVWDANVSSLQHSTGHSICSSPVCTVYTLPKAISWNCSQTYFMIFKWN
jgi:hypothetical protein